MAVEDPADRLAMLDPDEFGVGVVFIPNDASGPQDWLVVSGIYDDEHTLVELSEVAPISATQPRVKVREADIAGLSSEGWVAVVAGLADVFDIFDIRRDGTGLADVVLTKRR